MTNEEKIAQGLCVAQTDAETGEVTMVPYTDEEITAMNVQLDTTSVVIDPVIKLKQFLDANPDVAALLSNQ